MTASDLPAKNTSSATAIIDASFATIDWQAPWLSHLSQLSYLREQIIRLSAQNVDNKMGDSSDNKTRDFINTMIADVLNDAIQNQVKSTLNQLPQTKPISENQAYCLNFVTQDALPEGMGYEQFIAITGNIPTRDNLHDLFNGSIWLTFPKTKALLNYHHILEMSKSENQQSREQGTQQSRGRVRDTITVFDENGAIVVTADPSIGEALIDFNWQASLVATRNQWENPRALNSNAQAAVYIFGHALLEQLIQPRKALCAHSVIINVTPNFFALSSSERMDYLDKELAAQLHTLLSQPDITPRQLAPLPILGVPHFWADNADLAFYEDTHVFRAGRYRQV